MTTPQLRFPWEKAHLFVPKDWLSVEHAPSDRPIWVSGIESLAGFSPSACTSANYQGREGERKGLIQVD